MEILSNLSELPHWINAHTAIYATMAGFLAMRAKRHSLHNEHAEAEECGLFALAHAILALGTS